MHEILGKRFAARSKPGWHNIAKKIWGEQEVVTAEEAMVEVAGDVEVEQCPIYYELDGVKHKAERHTMIVRKELPDDNEKRVLGIASTSWVKAGYSTLAKALNDLGKSYKVETAGLLMKGGLAFICFRAQDWSVKGIDEMRTYFAANFSLTPGKGHSVFHSPVRVECWNTNQMAQSAASINLSIPHTTDAIQRIQLAANLASQFESVRGKTEAIFNSFADFHITQREAEAIFQAAYPDPSMPPRLKLLKQTLSETDAETFKAALTPDLLTSLDKAQEKYDKDRELVTALRRCAFERFEAFEPKKLSGTAWAAYNAATEVSDWREGRGADESLVIGSRAREKSRAYVETAKIVSA